MAIDLNFENFWNYLVVGAHGGEITMDGGWVECWRGRCGDSVWNDRVVVKVQRWGDYSRGNGDSTSWVKPLSNDGGLVVVVVSDIFGDMDTKIWFTLNKP